MKKGILIAILSCIVIAILVFGPWLIKEDCSSENYKKETLEDIHKKLNINHGSLKDELPEQRMTVNYLSGTEKVLELGGNIGRNSLIIAYILNKKGNRNFVTLESDPISASKLKENKQLNKLQFHIESSALSKRPLIQKDWNTKVSDKVLDGYKRVNTISFHNLEKKYKIKFDTLVLDCEGCFLYILMDMPEILKNMKLIIMENDYNDISDKRKIDSILKKNNFKVDYSEEGGWGPCQKNFFEVWKK